MRSSRASRIDERLLPVGLVVVGPVERRPPVVHGVEEQVLQDDPLALPNHSAVVRDRRITRSELVVFQRRGRGGPAGDLAADEKRGYERRVEQPGRQPDAGEPAGCLEWRTLGGLVEPRELDRVERLLDEAQEPEVSGRRVAGRRQAGSVELSGRDEDFESTRRGPGQEVARFEVPLGGHREELLALGEPEHGLEAAQEHLVNLGRRASLMRGRLQPTARFEIGDLIEG